MVALMSLDPSVPNPKFATFRSTHHSELRIRKEKRGLNVPGISLTGGFGLRADVRHLLAFGEPLFDHAHDGGNLSKRSRVRTSAQARQIEDDNALLSKVGLVGLPIGIDL